MKFSPEWITMPFQIREFWDTDPEDTEAVSLLFEDDLGNIPDIAMAVGCDSMELQSVCTEDGNGWYEVLVETISSKGTMIEKVDGLGGAAELWEMDGKRFIFLNEWGCGTVWTSV
jgi:hypothetical protein